MGRTIGHHLPSGLPSGAFACCCDICGFLYYRHELRRQPDGTLACADDFGGDVVTLTEAQAEAAMELTLPQEVQDGGRPGPRNEDTPPTINWPDGVEPAF